MTENYGDYTRNELVDKIRGATAQLKHIKTWLVERSREPEDICHAIDHAISELSGDAERTCDDSSEEK